MKLILKPLSIVSTITGAALVIGQSAGDAGKTWIGVPYLYGGDSRAGIDCSALSRRAFREVQMELPRTASQQALVPGSTIGRSNLIVDDLVFFATDPLRPGQISHVGIYLGGGQFINANSTFGVKVDNIDDSYWRSRFLYGRRVATQARSGSRVLLRPWQGGKPAWRYYMAHNGGGGDIAGNSPNPWNWETFTIYVDGGGPVTDGSWVYLRSSNGLYLSSDGSWRRAKANRTGVAGWELFRVNRELGAGTARSGDRIALIGWQGLPLGANYSLSDWGVGCFFTWGGWGGWETITLVVK